MSKRTAGWLGVVAAVWTVAGILMASRLHTLSGTPDLQSVDLVWGLSWTGLPVVGAVVVAHRPDNRVGWMLCGIGATLALSLAAASYAEYSVLARGGRLPLTGVALWLAGWTFVVATGLVVLLVATFPTGRLPAGRWRFVARGGVTIFTALLLVAALLPFPDPSLPRTRSAVALGGRIGEVLESIYPILGTLAGFVALVALGRVGVALFRSRSELRQQLKWFAAPVLLFPVINSVAGVFEDSNAALSDLVEALAFFLGLQGIAIGIGVAVLRYRLYAIDRILSRTITYAIVSAALAGVFLVAVSAIGLLLPAGGDSPLAVAASTLAAASVFRPVRRGVQNTVDRRFHRTRYDAAREVETYRAHVREVVDLDAVIDGLLHAAVRTVHPAGAGLWLRRPVPSASPDA